MATAKKLPSGSWRCQVYSPTEEFPQPDGNIKRNVFTNLSPVTILHQKESANVT